MLSDSHREAIRESNKRRAYNCPQCGSSAVEKVDGSKIGGVPTITYRSCPQCGWSKAITKRMR